MSRGRRKKFKLRFNVKPDTVRSIISIVFLALCFIGLVSFFAPSYSINSKIQHFLKSYFGQASVLIPLILGSFGILFFDNLNSKYKEARIFIGLFLLLFSLSGAFHVFINSSEAYDLASEGKGGGLVGYKISNFLSSGISKFGASVFLILGVMGSLLLVFNISFGSLVNFFTKNEFFSRLFGNVGNLFRKESIEEDENIEIDSSSGNLFLGEDSDDGVLVSSGKSRKKPEQTSIFEVVQSQAEPLIDIKTSSVDTLAPPSSIKMSPVVPSDRIWNYPPEDLLAEPPVRTVDTSDLDKKVKIIKETLKSFGIDVDIDMENVKVGSSVTQYALRPRSVTNVAKIATLQSNLALALASPTGTVRIEAPIPGKSLIGIEVPNTKRTLVYFKSLISSPQMKNFESKLGVALGEDVAGRVVTYDIGKMPHLLIAGTTGSGKSVFIHNILFSILFRATPQEVKFILIDPKRVELILYEGIPHLLTPVVTDMEKAPSVFRWAVEEMERRYRLFEQARVKNIDTYNEKSGIQVMPYIVIVVDELGDIMLQDPAGVEKNVIRLAQMGRATGVHLILAVQRPSIDVITGLIKANIPCRVAFQVLNQIDSRVIIDQPGAEKLLGKGDMLFVPPDTMKPLRLQGAFISEKETADLVNFLKNQGVPPDYKEEVLNMPTSTRGGVVKSSWGEDVDDELFDKAVAIVVSAKKASASLLQRKLSIGFARAAKLIDMMEDRGIVGGEVSGSRGREVLIDEIPGEDDFSVDRDMDLEFDKEDFTGENFPRNRDSEE